MGVARELAELGSAYNSGGINQFRNRIINGAMMIDQRNAGASVTQTTGNLFPVDRFAIYGDVASKFTAQRSTTSAAGFSNSLLITSSSSYSVGAGEVFTLAQFIEGFNVADFGFGTANAKAITLSFWVRSSLTGTFGGVVQNGTNARSYPFSYTISAANTFEYKTITIAGDTSGTWATDNSTGLTIRFGLGVGSTKSGTAGSWASADYRSATGATSVVGTNGATFYITGVQLEKGSTATSFDYRPYSTEFDLCERYYQIVEGGYYGSSANGGSNAGKIYFKRTMRASATVTWQSTLRNFGGGWTVGAPVGYYMTTDGTRYAHPYKTASATVQDAEFWDRYALSAEL